MNLCLYNINSETFILLIQYLYNISTAEHVYFSVDTTSSINYSPAFF